MSKITVNLFIKLIKSAKNKLKPITNSCDTFDNRVGIPNEDFYFHTDAFYDYTTKIWVWNNSGDYVDESDWFNTDKYHAFYPLLHDNVAKD